MAGNGAGAQPSTLLRLGGTGALEVGGGAKALADSQMKIRMLQADATKHAMELELMGQENSALCEEFEAEVGKVNALTERVESLEGEVEYLRDLLVPALQEAVERMMNQAGFGVDLAAGTADGVDGVDGVDGRAMLRGVIHVLPDPIPINDNGSAPVFWLQAGREKLLRLNWTLGWEENELGWVQAAAERIKENGHHWDATARKENIDALSIADIARKIQTIFESY
ncbi:hypothetical protein OF83DRAFT_1089108, partial [Amylostereum chailletii]